MMLETWQWVMSIKLLSCDPLIQSLEIAPGLVLKWNWEPKREDKDRHTKHEQEMTQIAPYTIWT